MQYSKLAVVPIFLFLLFSIGEFGYSLPADLTDDSEHTEKSLLTRQIEEGVFSQICKSTLYNYITS
jgi:hypothetical protein